MISLEERVAWALSFIKNRDKITNIQLSKVFDVDKNTVQTYCHGKGNFKGSVLSIIVRDYGFNGEWLMAGKGEPFPGAREKFPEVCGPFGITEERQEQLYSYVKSATGQYGIQPDEAPDEFVFINQVNGKISAGAGLSPDNTINMRLAFRKEWLKRKGDPLKMSLIKISGDSMEPTLLSGDLVLIDHSRTIVASHGGIYAISIDHEILIKRLQLLFQAGKILVISDNKQYPPQEIDTDKITINGKVIWYAREIER
jgi:phage repressor protein C with HTH and peptisase S24 domain